MVTVPVPVPGPGLVHTPLTHSPLAQAVPAVQGEPSGPDPTTVPQTPFVQAPLAHSVALAQLFPFGRPEPLAHAPLVHVPLEHWLLLVQALPEGAPWPLPTHAPPVHTPLAQSAALVQLPFPGWPLAQEPPRQSPLEHSPFAVQVLPPTLLPLPPLEPPVPVPEPPAPVPVPPAPVPVPQTPFVQAPLAHSVALVQLFPSGRPEPPAHAPLVHVPLAHWALLVQALPEGAPLPLPTHAPPVHTPLKHSLLAVQLLPPTLVPPPTPASPDDPQEYRPPRIAGSANPRIHCRVMLRVIARPHFQVFGCTFRLSSSSRAAPLAAQREQELASRDGDVVTRLST
jgi:hypothetical protein